MSPLYLAWQARLEGARDFIEMMPEMADRRDSAWASIEGVKGTLVGFVGPSGAGKDSIREASGIACALQTTTRSQREMELTTNSLPRRPFYRREMRDSSSIRSLRKGGVGMATDPMPLRLSW